MKNIRTKAVFACLVILCSISSTAEIVKKRYSFEISGAGSRRAMQMKAEGLARRRIISDYIQDKLSPDFFEKYREDIEISLTPSENYLKDFKVLAVDEGDGSKVVITVQGNVDLPSVLESLTASHVLRFGKPAPKLLLFPSKNSNQFGVTKAIRALVFDHLKQVGLQPVAFEGVSRVTSIQGKVSGEQVKIIASSGLEYQADYVMFIDAQPDIKPASVGGFICDLNLTYTILRPNNNVILGEAVASERGSGSSQQAALDRALDSLAPVITTRAIGQLYESIFADSDVLMDSQQLKNSVTLTVLFKDNAQQTQAIVNALKEYGAQVTMASGGAADRFVVESAMNATQLYSFMNSLVLRGPELFRTPVVEFREGLMSVEIVKEGSTAKNSIAPAPSMPRKSAAVVNLRK
jgi:hypothetical protein